MDRIQIIDTPAGEKMAVMPLTEYERLRVLANEDEDDRDIRQAEAIMARVRHGKETLIPLEVSEKIWKGASPIRAWREYRRLTAEKLARKTGIARAFLTQIEQGKRKGSVATLRKLAKILKVTVDALLG